MVQMKFGLFDFDTFKRGDIVDKLHHHKLGIFGMLKQQKPRIATLIIPKSISSKQILIG